MEERDCISDLDDVVGGVDSTDQDAVDGGGWVFERVKNEFDVCVLCDLILQSVATHHSLTVRVLGSVFCVLCSNFDVKRKQMQMQSTINCCGLHSSHFAL